ncbi:MAG TPA: NAD(P)-binding oxidoreductase [Chitinophagaceae bacterium]|nr:NAD(P)-binding oxidoreductase [Chitinophagaceae bacterium]
MEKILFIGASGMLGKPVARELIRAGFELTLFGRDTEKLEKFFPNIHTVQGDVFNTTSLLHAMKGQDIVYLNLSINQRVGKSGLQPEREGIKNIFLAAKNAGIKRISYLSSLIKNYRGMNEFRWWAFDVKHAAIDSIKKSGIPYSIFYPSTFMETIDQQMLQGNKIIIPGKSEAPMWFIAAKDYGEQVAWAFKKAGDDSFEYPIQGLEPFTLDEAVRIFISNYKKPVSLLRVPMLSLKLTGLISNKMNYAANICEALNKYPEKFVSEKSWEDLGKPSVRLADYAASLNIQNPVS